MNNYDNTNKGAVWLRTSKNGLKYMSGTIDVNGIEYDIAMFKNDKKGNDNAPDYRLTISNKKGGQAVQDKSQEVTNDQSDPYKEFGAEIALTDDDLPF